jgi:hypothetical protein
MPHSRRSQYPSGAPMPLDLTKPQRLGATNMLPLAIPFERQCDGQIFQITPVPGIWTSGPLAGGPTKCESSLRSRTAP